MNTHSKIVATLAALGLGAACVSDEEQPVINRAGAGGTGSVAAGSAGNGGAAGAGGSAAAGAAGSAGNTIAAGSAGAAPEQPEDVGSGRDCPAEVPAPPAGGLLANFSGDDAGVDAGVALGQLFAFPLGSPNAPSFEIANGALHITANIAPTSEPQYTNVLFGFPGCLDASAFSGVAFSIRGSFSGCTMQYASGDVAHQDQSSGAPYATGPVGSYQPQATITAAQLTAEPQTLLMPFVGGPSGGNPATAVDEAKLIFLLWQFTIDPGSSGPPCVADVSIDDVTFY